MNYALFSKLIRTSLLGLLLAASAINIAGCRASTAASHALSDAESPAVEASQDSDMGWHFVEGFRFPVEFEMGGRFGNELPVHSVRLTRPFAVQATEVTQSQWLKVMGSSPSFFTYKDINRNSVYDDGIDQPYCDDFDSENTICPNHPVENVTWYSVQEFIGKLNEINGLDCGNTKFRSGFLQASLTSGCYRLPTEAEWEFFTRAGAGTPFNTGQSISATTVNYNGNYPYEGGPLQLYRKQTIAVGSLDNRNQLGLYDTHGNVGEWVQDWFRADYYQHSPLENPIGGPTGLTEPYYRVVRGGDYNAAAKNCRSAVRGVGSPQSDYGSVGFRLVRTTD